MRPAKRIARSLEPVASGRPRCYSFAVAAPTDIRIRPLSELDISRIVSIDERLTGVYRPEVWERRVAYYLRRDPEACPVAELNGNVVGFMFSDVRGGEFGLEEPTGWIERFGVDPDYQGRSIGRRLFEAVHEHLKRQGTSVVLTLVDQKDADLASFLRALGFKNATLQALERRVDGAPTQGPGT
jgi:ribosomal protein S18 acetylase RimI-like enzyme